MLFICIGVGENEWGSVLVEVILTVGFKYFIQLSMVGGNFSKKYDISIFCS